MSTQLCLDSYQPITKPVQPRPEVTLRPQSQIKKEFEDIIRNLSYSRHTWQVWQDFCEMATYSISNTMMPSKDREKRYMAIVDRYDRKDIILFPKLLSLVIEAMDGQYQDFLGTCFMEMELGSHWTGQFFTPYHVCKAIAEVSFDVSIFDQKDIVTVNEPAAGAGAMIVALCDYLRHEKVDFQHRLRATCQDLSATAAHMCYVQLSLIGCPAHVIIGDSLKVECREKYVTPMAVMAGWWN